MTGVDLPMPGAAGLRRLPGHPAAYFGSGAADRLGGLLTEFGARRVLLVHGRSYDTSGAARVVAAWHGSLEVHHFGDVRPNPGISQVEEAVELVRTVRPDAVIGLGGGSSMDVAKAASVLAAQQDVPTDCLSRPGLVDRPRFGLLVLVPTTAGSGSELTRFATLYHEGRKLSLDTPLARADIVLVDPVLSSTVPLPVLIAGALDALCQAVESIWSLAGTEQSRHWAGEALKALLPALGHLADGGSHTAPEIRYSLALGASLAGAAIDISRTTAAHALSYALTSRLGLPHGVAVALHLRWLLGRHSAAAAAECPPPRGAAVSPTVAPVRPPGRGLNRPAPQEL
ncbi:iron-containing alcohol dehydrogenase [Streptomyces goshikiensis]|uniref:iron-containing alcohol dehydrogenase n=1 Tax=Streptomyces goshikiensis TaxID=1942 RepID=UPI00368A8D15